MAQPESQTSRGGDFEHLLRPRGIAIIGASTDAARIGGQPFHILREHGYAGPLYPVNPKYREMHGVACYADAAELPQPCDVALVALPARHVADAVRGCGKAGVGFAIVLSAGFSESGEEGRALQQELISTARAAGVRVVGPNCLGVVNIRDGVRCGFGPSVRLPTLRPGPLAMVAQSGGVGLGLVAMIADAGVGCDYAVSTGNEADVTALDFIAHFLERDEVRIVACFLEGVTDGRRLRAIGRRARELAKPVLVWKVGNTDAGRMAALSHTARMTAGYDLYRTAFAEGGFVEIEDVDDIVDCARIFLPRTLPAGRRVGVVSVSGGAAVLFADRCVAHGLDLPPFSAATADAVRGLVAPFVRIENPLDATANTNVDGAAAYLEVIRHVLADPGIDQAIVRAPRSRDAAAWGNEFVKLVNASGKPVIVNWPSSEHDHGELLQLLQRQRVPCFAAPGRAVRALAKLNDFAARQRMHAARSQRSHSAPGMPPACALPPGAGTLGERASKSILAACGVPVVRELALSAEAVAALREPPLAFPLAVKIDSPDLPHKTEAGAVRLGIDSLDALKRAAVAVAVAARKHAPHVRIDGLLVQEMADGLEVIVGVVNDPYFGPTVTFGLGGVLTELLEDTSRRFAPFDVVTAREMILEIRGARILQGYRGSAPLDVGALAEVLSRVSRLAADHADRIVEIDVNPLFVRRAGAGVVAADALIVLGTEA